MSVSTSSACIAFSRSASTPCSGESFVIWCITVHVRMKVGVLARTSGRSTTRRMDSPSFVTSAFRMAARIVASTTWLRRSFATRNINVGTPSRSLMTAFAAHKMRARGRANFANASPVTTALPNRLTIASNVTSQCAPRDAGYM